MTKSLLQVAEDRPIHVLFACFRDKNVERMLAYLGEFTRDIVLTTFPHDRARKEDEYNLYLEDFAYQENALSSLQEMIEQYPEDCILVTGSLAFAAYIKNHLI